MGAGMLGVPTSIVTRRDSSSYEHVIMCYAECILCILCQCSAFREVLDTLPPLRGSLPPSLLPRRLLLLLLALSYTASTTLPLYEVQFLRIKVALLQLVSCS